MDSLAQIVFISCYSGSQDITANAAIRFHILFFFYLSVANHTQSCFRRGLFYVTDSWGFETSFGEPARLWNLLPLLLVSITASHSSSTAGPPFSLFIATVFHTNEPEWLSFVTGGKVEESWMMRTEVFLLDRAVTVMCNLQKYSCHLAFVHRLYLEASFLLSLAKGGPNLVVLLETAIPSHCDW